MNLAPQHGIFVLSFWRFRLGVDHKYGFVIGDQWRNSDVDYPGRLDTHLGEMGTLLYEALNYKGVLPNEAMGLLSDCESNGYIFFHKAAQEFHPALVNRPHGCAMDYPHQQEGQSFDDHNKAVHWHLAVKAFLFDTDTDFGIPLHQDTYIAHLLHSDDIMIQVERERNSPNVRDRQKYIRSTFINTIRGLSQNLIAREPRDTHSLRDTHSHSRFNSFSERSSSRQVNALALDPGVVSLNALEATLDLSSERSITNYAIHGLRIGSQHGTHLDDIRLLSNFINTVATNVRNNNPRSFDTSRPCAVCNRTGHTFDDCPLLQNKEEVTLAYTRIVSALCCLLP